MLELEGGVGGFEQRSKIAGVRGADERFEMGANSLRFVRVLGESVGKIFHIGLQIRRGDSSGRLQVSHGSGSVRDGQDARVKFKVSGARRLYFKFGGVVCAARCTQFLRVAASKCEHAWRFIFNDDAKRLVRSANVHSKAALFPRLQRRNRRREFERDQSQRAGY